MTEAEWLASTDPTPMLECVRGTATSRKLRLAVCACYRRCTDHPKPLGPSYLRSLLRDALDLVEGADGDLTPVERNRSILDNLIRGGRVSSSTVAHRFVTVGSRLLAERCSVDEVMTALTGCRYIVAYNASYRSFDPANQAALAAEPAEQARLLREVFGNPFRPVAVDPAWLTSTVTALTRGIDREQAFDRLPILADALQDAGCDDADVLGHCRSNGPHVRGCWVVDLVLGKA